MPRAPFLLPDGDRSTGQDHSLHSGKLRLRPEGRRRKIRGKRKQGLSRVVGFQRFFQNQQRACQVLLIEDIGQPDLVLPQAGSTVESSCRCHHQGFTGPAVTLFPRFCNEIVRGTLSHPDRHNRNPSGTTCRNLPRLRPGETRPCRMPHSASVNRHRESCSILR